MAADLVPVSELQSADETTRDRTARSSHLLKNAIRDSSFDFLRASPSLHEAALLISKVYLDPLATSVSYEQNERLRAARRKRKRGDDVSNDTVLQLKQLHLQGFSTDQIWEQSKRILDATASEIQLVTKIEDSHNAVVSKKKSVQFEEHDSTAGSEVGDAEMDSAEEDFEDAMDDDSDNEEDLEQDFEQEPQVEDDFDGSDIEADDSDDPYQDQDEKKSSNNVFIKDKHGLNDGFFSIDDFNRATEFLEQVDARGDPNDGAASDEEDVDWALDPMSQPLPDGLQQKTVKGKSQIDDDDGPTFGDADLNASWTDDDTEEEDDDEMEDAEDNNANEIYYKDFFAPPPRALTKTKRMRALPKTQPTEPEEEDIQRTISAVHRDIFSDDDIEGSEQSDEAAIQNLSTHERRQRALAEQIRKLEAEAIAKRQWTLAGEARAADRPVNSLLEDDLVLDFERIGKPVPEATVAVTEAIEDLIKSRILARNFDEIPKRIGGLNSNDSAQGKRGLIELDDRKNSKSLAEIYENEHLKATDPNYVDSRDTETKKAHQEIELLWKEVSAKLDSLTSWHYKPKPADMEVRVITDAPRVQMEDARPADVGISAEESGLAPQEVYRVGEELNGKKGDANVVLTAGGSLIGRAELTREQKVRRRRREKERIKKRGSESTVPAESSQKPAAPAKRSKKTDEKKNILDELRRGNVNIIGKGGAVQDVDGRKAMLGATSKKNAGVLKL